MHNFKKNIYSITNWRSYIQYIEIKKWYFAFVQLNMESTHEWKHYKCTIYTLWDKHRLENK